jgi:hypothetical protein
MLILHHNCRDVLLISLLRLMQVGVLLYYYS